MNLERNVMRNIFGHAFFAAAVKKETLVMMYLRTKTACMFPSIHQPKYITGFDHLSDHYIAILG